MLASAVGMDKEFGKRLAREAGLRVTPFLVLRTGSWNLSNVKSQVEEFWLPRLCETEQFRLERRHSQGR